MAFLSFVIPKATDNKLPYNLHVRDGYYHVTVPSSTLLSLQLRQRDAYPGTYCEQLPDGTVRIGYGVHAQTTNDEFLRAELAPDGSFSITRDAIATLPLYYTETANALIISNSYAAVVAAASSLTVEREHLPRMLLQDKDTYSHTLWQEVHVLGERQKLTVQNGTVKLQLPKPRAWQKSMDVAPQNPTQYQEKLDTTFEHFCNTRLKGQRFSFELSGGLDSATLPLYIHRHYPQVPLHAVALSYPGDEGKGQAQKLGVLGKALGAQPVMVPLDPMQHYPLARYLHGNANAPFSPYDMIYEEANQAIAKQLEQAGIQVVVTGVGGDDIHENIVTPEQHFGVGRDAVERQSLRMPPFVSPQFMQDWQRAHEHPITPPTPTLPASIHTIHLARSNIYIERGIWPVSPFTSPAFYEFCQGLPAYMRANKNILRAYHQAYNFPAEIYAAKHNENFEPFLREVFASGAYDQALDYFGQHSVLAQLGHINAEGLTWLRNHLKDPTIDQQWLFYLFTWLSIELNLRQLRSVQ